MTNIELWVEQTDLPRVLNSNEFKAYLAPSGFFARGIDRRVKVTVCALDYFVTTYDMFDGWMTLTRRIPLNPKLPEPELTFQGRRAKPL